MKTKVLISSTPLGTGKTRQIATHINDNKLRALVLAPTHDLADEIAKYFPGECLQIRGRDLMVRDYGFGCPHAEEISARQNRGLSTHGHFCAESKGCCSKRTTCEYLQQFTAAASARVVILTHDHLMLSADIWISLTRNRDCLVIDECFLGKFRREEVITRGDLNALKKAIEGSRGLGHLLHDWILPLQELLNKRLSTPLIFPAGQIVHGRHLRAIDEQFSAPSNRHRNVIRILIQAAQQQAPLRLKENYHHAGREHSRAVVVNLMANIPRDLPIVVLDSTCEPEYYAWALGDEFQVKGINPAAGKRLQKNARVVQCLSGGYANATVLNSMGELTKSGQRIVDFLEGQTRALSSYGIIATKKLARVLEKTFPPDRLMNFNNLRGLNKFRDVQKLFILGYQGISYPDIARNARIMFGQEWDDIEEAQNLESEKDYVPIEHYAHGLQTHVMALSPSNKFIAAYYRMIVRGEVEQALGRARIYLPTAAADREVYLLTNMPVGVEIDEIFVLGEEAESDEFSKLLQAAADLLATSPAFSRDELAGASGVSQTAVAENIDLIRARLDLVEETGKANKKSYRRRLSSESAEHSEDAGEIITSANDFEELGARQNAVDFAGATPNVQEIDKLKTFELSQLCGMLMLSA